MNDAVSEAPAPSGVLLGLGAAAATGVSLVAWMLIAVVAAFSVRWSGAWVHTGLALPAATIGSAAAYSTRRQAYFWIGIAITLIPLLAYILLSATTEPQTTTWVD